MNRSFFGGNTNLNMMGMEKPKTPEDLLKELESIISFSSLTPAAMMSLRNLQHQASLAFARKDRLSPDLLGNGYLYTTIRRTDRFDHFVIETDEDKIKIDKILEAHRPRDMEKWPSDMARQRSLFEYLTELGCVLKMISTDPHGNPLGKEGIKVSFAQLVTPNFPTYRLGVSPEGLPRLIIQYPINITNQSPSSELAKALEEEILENVRVSPELSREDAFLIKNYFSHNAVFQVYLESLEKRVKESGAAMGQGYLINDSSSYIQIHLFPRGSDDLVVCTDNLLDGDGSFIKREDYPELFFNRAYSVNYQPFNPGW